MGTRAFMPLHVQELTRQQNGTVPLKRFVTTLLGALINSVSCHQLSLC
jgi:hypothetical protein